MKSRVLSLAAAVAISLSGALTTVAATPASAATTSASLVPTFSSVGVY